MAIEILFLATIWSCKSTLHYSNVLRFGLYSPLHSAHAAQFLSRTMGCWAAAAGAAAITDTVRWLGAGAPARDQRLAGYPYVLTHARRRLIARDRQDGLMPITNCVQRTILLVPIRRWFQPCFGLHCITLCLRFFTHNKQVNYSFVTTFPLSYTSIILGCSFEESLP